MKLVGERRALASSALIFFAFLHGLAALMSPPDWTQVSLAMAIVYGLGFFSVVAGYFWARWYAIGIGLFGTLSAAVGIWQLGPEPIFLIFGGVHLGVVLALSGQAMREPFEDQPSWRARFHMDDHGVHRLGRSVVRASIGLPFVLLYALAPKPGSALVALAAVLTVGGLAGVVRLRAWGALALGGAAGAALAAACFGSFGIAPAAVVLTTAAAPFAGPVARALRG
ncbi:MAG: hypothetical protein R3B48_04305 [Kofleriaceae bacterium]